jgi:protein tyrosine/serine phosphatase
MQTMLRARAGAVMVAAALTLGAYPAWAADTTQAGTLTAALAKIHIDNFGHVDDHYFRGGQPKGQDYADLAALGVKTVIDLADDSDPGEGTLVQNAKMKFIAMPMTTHQAPAAATIAKFLALVNDPANQPVYVHCVGGRHRTGVMTAIYRMTVDGWTPAKAFAEMKQYRFGADWLHPEFKDFVMAYTAAAPAASSASSTGTIRQ